MKEKWYESPATWGCLLLCAVLLALGLTMDGRGAHLPAEENLRVRVTEDCGVYQLQFDQKYTSGGVLNADGSAMAKGQIFGWEAGEGRKTVAVTALDAAGRVLFATTVTHDFSAGPCTLLLSAGGFIPAEES